MQESDYQDLYEFFLLRNYKWTYDNGKRIPSPEDIKQMLSNCKDAIISSKQPGEQLSVSSGRLEVKECDGRFEVWVWAGDLG